MKANFYIYIFFNYKTETVEEPIDEDAAEPEKEASEDEAEVEEEEEDKDKPKTKKVRFNVKLVITKCTLLCIFTVSSLYTIWVDKATNSRVTQICRDLNKTV